VVTEIRKCGRTARCVQCLHEHNFILEHRQGHKHTNADALSRRPCPKEFTHCQKVEQRAGSLRVRVTAAAATDGSDRSALRRQQLADQDMGHILREMEAGQRPERKDSSSIYKRYWTQWESLVVTDCVLKRHWESADRGTKREQIVFPRCWPSSMEDLWEEALG
jgi:hypothetical protein